MVIIMENILIFGRRKKRTIGLRDTANFLLQWLRFSTNQKKSVISPVQKIESLAMLIKSIKQMCLDLYHNPQTSFKVTEGVRSPGISNFGHSHSKPPLSFSSTVANSDIANKWLLQSYRNPVLLNKESRMEFFRWMTNIEKHNWRTLIQLLPQTL